MDTTERPEDYAARVVAAARERTLAGWTLPAAHFVPREIRRVGVIGAGVMGSGIAQWCAAHGRNVLLHDVNDRMLARGLQVARDLFDGAVRRGKCSDAAARAGLRRLQTTTAWDGFGDCDLIIEAIVENVTAKQRLFAELATVARPDAVLATNTSALPLEQITARMADAARVVGLHFFNPVGRMPLVELVVGRKTARPTAEAALRFVLELGKLPVICRSSPGFLVTRVLFFYLNEACRLWAEGVSTERIDAAMRGWGWPMGPMRLIDEVGVDVTDFIFSEMAHYFPERFERSVACERLLERGLQGRKNGTGSGFYRHEGRDAVPDPGLSALQPRGGATADDIVRRLMTVMVVEARHCVAEGVVGTAEDVDFSLLTGAGFPMQRGGLLRWAANVSA